MKRIVSPHPETYQSLSPRFMESAPEAIVVADRDGRVVLVNVQTERLFGYRRDELLGQSVEVLLPARLREAHLGYRREYHTAPAIRLMGSTRLPVARRKDGAVMITDLQSRILDVNPAFERLTGFQRAKALGQKPGLIRSPHTTPAFYRQMWEQIRTHGHWAGEIVNQRKNGTTWDSLLTVSTVRDERGQPVAYVGINRDITELKDLQREREALLEAEQQRAAQLAASYDHTLDALAAALDARDKETEGHSRRVVAYTLALARRLNVSADELMTIQRGALLHDIGKIGVPDAILHKPGPLTEEEWVIMRRHPEWGERILRGIPFLDGAREIVCAHHERWDGGGYPGGLAGEAIPLGARIFALADTFDAITSDRPYRAGRPYAVAQAAVVTGGGTQFEPRVVAAFLQAPEEQWARLRAESLPAPDPAGR